jgi:hypothetical protein
MQFMLIGTTYSHTEINWLKLDPKQSLDDVLGMGFDILRLGCYWKEIQPTATQFDFSTIKNILDHCQEQNQRVVLTVGMKAPRWPEFYIPDWVQATQPMDAQQQVLAFIGKTVDELQSYRNIIAWQVENEPCDPSGPNQWRLPERLVLDEVQLVRQHDPCRPIILNLWGDNIVRRPDFSVIQEIADVIGIDLYYKQPNTDGSYHGPKYWDWQLAQFCQGLNRCLWITELQAEPWENDEKIRFSTNPPSMNPSLLRQNVQRTRKINPQVILLWGCEYWLWQKDRGNSDLFNEVLELIKMHRASSEDS